MLKEFSFYKVARLVDVEQRQAHLDVLEKKKNIKKGLCAKPLVQLPGQFQTLPPWSTKKNTIIRRQTQEFVIDLDKTFRAEKIEQCETVELIVPPIVEEAEEKE